MPTGPTFRHSSRPLAPMGSRTNICLRQATKYLNSVLWIPPDLLKFSHSWLYLQFYCLTKIRYSEDLFTSFRLLFNFCTKVEDLLSLKCISKVTRCLYVLAMLVSKDYAFYGPKLSNTLAVREKKTSVPECDRANLANVNISNIFWNLMENAERRKSVHQGQKRKPSLVDFWCNHL